MQIAKRPNRAEVAARLRAQIEAWREAAALDLGREVPADLLAALTAAADLLDTPARFRATWHYAEDDPECMGDYYSIELFAPDGARVAAFGDYYHDKGDAKLAGFLCGVAWATGVEPEVEEEEVADGAT